MIKQKIDAHVLDNNHGGGGLEIDPVSNQEPDVENLVKCEDCENYFPPDVIRPYKYEPTIKLCDDCHDQRMGEEEEI